MERSKDHVPIDMPRQSVEPGLDQGEVNAPPPVQSPPTWLGRGLRLAKTAFDVKKLVAGPKGALTLILERILNWIVKKLMK